jgi:hypothetical protein
MRTSTILVVARESEWRKEIAGVLLASDHFILCACDTAEVIDFELTGVAWTVIVFAGSAAASDAAAYLRRSSRRAPLVVVRAPTHDYIEARSGRDAVAATLESLGDIVARLLAVDDSDKPRPRSSS